LQVINGRIGEALGKLYVEKNVSTAKQSRENEKTSLLLLKIESNLALDVTRDKSKCRRKLQKKLKLDILTNGDYSA
jgi:hypothetical protein